MGFEKELKLKENLVQAVYLLAGLFILGFVAQFVGIGGFLYSFPMDNWIGLIVTFTVAGVLKTLVESKVYKVNVKGHGTSAIVQKGLFTGIYMTIGLYLVGLLAGFVGFSQFLLDFQVMNNLFPIVVTLTLVAIIAEMVQEKFKLRI